MMAHRLSNFDFTEPERAKERDRYPWGEWFDGSIWYLEHDTDFKRIHPLVMERMVRTRASTNGYLVRIRHLRGGTSANGDEYGVLVIQATPKGQPYKSAAKTVKQRQAVEPAKKAAPRPTRKEAQAAVREAAERALATGIKPRAKKGTAPKAAAKKAPTKAPAKRALRSAAR
jgi:hypothetical protein